MLLEDLREGPIGDNRCAMILSFHHLQKSFASYNWWIARLRFQEKTILT